MPAITSAPQYLLASNLSCVWIKTQDSLGAYDNPLAGGIPVRVVGTPKFAVRGAGIIARADVYTPFGGNSASKTGGIGWDITFTTEFFWNPEGTYDATLASKTQLAPLFLASPWAISNPTGDDTLLAVQPYFIANPTRALAYNVQPFSIAFEESGGKSYMAYDCVCVPKFSWDYGGKVLIEWSAKGKWLPVGTSTDTVPSYVDPADQAPIIGVDCGLTMAPLFDNVNAVSKVTIETGWAISDVADMRETHGFGLGFIALTASPSLEIAVADYSEFVEGDWAAAENNTIYGDLELSLAVGANSFVWTFPNAQALAFPAPSDQNGYRSLTVKFISLTDGTVPLLSWVLPSTGV